MAIVKMSKFNLLSFDFNRDKLLDILQGFNYVHFNDLEISEDEDYFEKVENSQKVQEIDDGIQRVKFVEENIKKFSNDNKSLEIKDLKIDELNKKALNLNFESLYSKIKSLVSERDEKINENQKYSDKISQLTPWKSLDLDLSVLYNSKRVFFETGMIPKSYYEKIENNLEETDLSSIVFEEVYKDDANAFVYVLCNMEEKEKALEFLRANGFNTVVLENKTSIFEALKDFEEKKKVNNQKIKELEEELASYRFCIPDLGLYYSYLRNLRKKEESSEFFLKSKTLNYIEGYIPKDYQEKFYRDLDNALGKDNYALDMKDADKDDEDVPIILKNKKLIEPFESVVETYSLPKYNEMDPTSFIGPFYAIYTGFMIGDMGYGLLGLIVSLFALFKMNLPKSTRKMIKLLTWMSSSAIVFGLIFGSFFGGIVSIPGLIDTQKDFNTLIVMSLVLGFVAMFASLGIKAYLCIKNGSVWDAICDVGFWYLAVGGAIFLALSFTGIIPKSFTKITEYIMIAGMIGIVLTGGRENKSFIAKAASGLYSLYGISSWIGDFVSFLRLMALVLSGGFVAYAINLIVTMVVGGGGIIGFIGGTLIFIVFQLFNMFLSYLSAYVHSLRLVYVEMFNKFYEGGGKVFREMVEDTNFVNIIRGGKNE